MAQFNENIKANNIKTLTLSDFKGVDYFNAKNNVAKYRATDARNFIYKNGANHKRNGWKQFADCYEIISNVDTPQKINGFWEFKYDSTTTLYIVHAGTKLYDFNPTTKVLTDITPDPTVASSSNAKYLNVPNLPGVYGLTYAESIVRTEEQKAALLSERKQAFYNKLVINDEPSYAVQRGKRLYIFCGTMLVYTKWYSALPFQFRLVEDDRDFTYAPIIATGIQPYGSIIDSQKSLEPYNKMTRLVRNRLVGTSTFSKTLDYLCSNYDSSELRGYGFPPNFTGDFNILYGTTLDISYDSNNNIENGQLGRVEVPIEKFSVLSLTLHFYDNDGEPYTGALNPEDIPGIIVEFKCIIPYSSFKNGYFLGKLDDYVTYASPQGASLSDYLVAYSIIARIEKDTEGRTYLRAQVALSSDYGYEAANVNNIYCIATIANESAYQLVGDVGDILSVKNLDKNYTLFHQDNGSDREWQYKDGLLHIYVDTAPLIEGQSNIEVCYISGNNSANDINKCTFGTIFGYDDIDYLFMSGNPNKPNYDWHSVYRGFEGRYTSYYAYPSIEEDLTYFPDTSYAVLGSPNYKITGYTFYDDGELAIHKEYSPVESSLWIRKAYLGDAVNTSGEVVDNQKDIKFSQYSAAIGEGCITHNSCVNLIGDKLFLSENGLYGIVLDHNSIQSNSRYARERSRFINNRLLQEENLQNAKCIVYDNKLFIAINTRVYIADAKFKTQIDYDDTEDTYTYEWWVWDNVPVRFWFIYNKKLCFGTDDGKICEFTKDTYVDEKYDYAFDNDLEVNQIGAIEYNSTKFDIADGDYIEFTSNNVFEEIMGEDANERFDASYLEYFIGKEIYLYNSNSDEIVTSGCYIASVDIDNNTYEIRNISTDDVTTWMDLTTDDDMYIKVDGRQKIIDHDKTNHWFYIEDSRGNGNPRTLFVSQDGISVTGRIYKANNVQSIWFTPILNFNTSNYLKTITQMTIIPEAVVNGELTVNWQTRYKETVEQNVIEHFNGEGVQIFDLNAVNWDAFTIETSSFAKSFTSWKKIRKFNFIQFSFQSDNDKDCAIHSFEIMYYFMEKNRGVR